MTAYEFRLYRQLGRGQFQGFLGQGLGNSLELEHDSARLDDRHPEFGGAFAFAHSGFGWLLGDRLIGEDPNPDLTAALDMTSQRHTGCFDLLIGNPGRFERLQVRIRRNRPPSRGRLCRERRPRCCLRNFTLFGINIRRHLRPYRPGWRLVLLSALRSRSSGAIAARALPFGTACGLCRAPWPMA